MPDRSKLTVIDLFDHRVELCGEGIVARCRGQTLTYRALQTRSSCLAEQLRSQGTRRGSRVVLVTTRSLEMLVAFFAILRAGACIVPLDHGSLSHSVIHEVIDRTHPSAVMATVKDDQLLAALDVNWVLCYDQTKLEDASEILCEKVSMNDPVYLIFTSGTTGKPKGVVIPQGALANYVQSNDPGLPFNLSVEQGDRVFLMFSPAFDACLGVVFSTVCNGGELVISAISDAAEHVAYCNILPCTPSILRTLNPLSCSEQLRKVFLGGEAPSESLVKHWARPGRRLYNAYGPSETTTASLISELVPGHEITLGQPMRNSDILLLDNDGRESDEGEIWISGPGLAIEYLDDQELTEQKFPVRDGVRYYRTGDYARKRAGNLFFLGRADSMVKHNGFLINIETEVIPTLLRQPNVEDASAVMVETKLIGVVTPQSLEGYSIRDAIARTCSSFLVPDEIVPVSSIPVNSRGKVDPKAIRSEILSRIKTSFPEVNPLTPAEELLRSAVAQCLRRSVDQVNMDATFWANGGSSLPAVHLINILQASGKVLSLTDIMSEQTLRCQSLCLRELKKGPALDMEGHKSAVPQPLSLIQRQMLTATLRKTSSHWLVLCVEMPICLSEPQTDRLQAALLALLQRHSALRSTMHIDQYQQTLNSDPDIRWETIDMTAEEWVSRDRTNIDILCQRISQIDLGKPIHFVRLVRNGHDRSVLYWLLHHSRIDGRSAEILIRELQALLGNIPLAPAPQYTTAVRRQGEILQGFQNHPGREFVEQAHERQLLAKPIYFVNAGDGGSDDEFDDVSLTDAADLRISTILPLHRLRAFCDEHDLTPSVVLYAAWARLLSVYTDNADVCFDIALSGRTLDMACANDVVGPMLNIIPLPLSVPADAGTDPSVPLRWLRAVQALVLRATEVQWHFADPALRRHRRPCDSLVSFHVDVTRRSALFSSSPPSSSSSRRVLNDWKVHDVQISDAQLTLLMCDAGEDLEISMLARDWAVMPSVRRMIGYFQRSICGLLEAGGVPLAPLLTQDEVEKLIDSTCRTSTTPVPADTTLVDTFRAAVHAYGQDTAVESAGIAVSFDVLDTRSSSAAASLAEVTHAGDVVALFSDGSVQWIVGLLAILKIGCTYCPIDVEQSVGRKRELLEACRATVILAPRRDGSVQGTHLGPGRRMIYVEDHEWSSHVPCFRPETTEPKFPAFLIYTSGTTGEPKGVALTSDALLSYISYPPARLFAAPGRRIAQTFSVGFDACLAEVFGTLCYGATLVLKHGYDFTANLRLVNATMMTPSLAASLDPKEFINLDTVLFGGEPVSQALADVWAKDRRLFNGYGPSECTIGSIFKELRSGERVALGRPIPRTFAYILDHTMQLSPQGVPGEICLSGDRVALGYLSCKKTDHDRFLPDPFRPGLRMFRTGDRGRWNEDMEVEFLGRRDRQIKFNGHRINLDDLEVAVRGYMPRVSQVAVLLHDNSLHIFVQAHNASVTDVTVQLSSRLPHYAQPLHVHLITSIPLTKNQKIDYTVLSEQILSGSSDHVGSPPLPLDPAIYRAWMSTLPGLAGHTSWSGNETFFELGGSSFLALQLARRLSDEMGCVVPISLILQNPTISEQRHALQDCKQKWDEAQKQLHISSLDVRQEERRPVQQATAEIYRFCSAFTHKSAYNMAVRFHVRGPVQVRHLHLALQTELDAHAIFRSRFDPESGLSLVFDAPRPVVVMRASRNDDARDVNKAFRLNDGPLVRVSVCTPTKNSCEVLFIVHHSILGLESFEHLFRKVSLRYTDSSRHWQRKGSIAKSIRGFGRVHPTQRPSLPSRNPVTSNLDTHRRFWATHLGDMPAPPLFSARPIRPIDNEDGFISMYLPAYLSRVTKACCVYGVTPQQLVVACLTWAVYAMFSISDVVIWIPTAGDGSPVRDGLGGGGSLDRLPVRVSSPRSPTDFSWADFLHAIRTTVEATLQHVMSSASIQAMLPTPTRDGVPQELAAFMASYQTIRPTTLCLHGCEVVVERIRAPGAKFPFMLEVSEQTDGIVLAFEYMRASIPDDEARRLAGQCRKTLQALCDEENAC